MPTLTKAVVDAELVERAGAYLGLAGWSVVVDGTNPNTVGALRYALAACGVGVASLDAVTDVDLGLVPDSSLDRLYDLAEWRLKKNLLSKLATRLFDQSIGDKSQSLSQVIATLQKEVVDLAASIRVKYGVGAASLVAGSFRANIGSCGGSEF